MFGTLAPTRLSRFEDEFDRLFRETFESFPRFGAWFWEDRAAYPALNLWEDGDNLYVEAELPGLKPEDLELTVLGDELCLRGERRWEEKEGVTWHRRERGFGKFVRTIRLPSPIASDRVQASFHNGVLTITLPKAEAARSRKVEVKRIEKK